MTLKCSFLVYPESSLDIVWLANYNHAHGRHMSNHNAPVSEPSDANQLGQTQTDLRGRLPAEERFIVLYDSKLHRVSQPDAIRNSTSNYDSATSNNVEQTSTRQYEQPDQLDQDQTLNSKQVSEISLYGSRILIRETRAAEHELGDATGILKESQIIIQSARADDSAR